MTRKSKIIAGSLAAIATLGAGAAIAQTQTARPDMTRAAATQRAATMFQKMDANSDGRIDAADREARQEARFARLDTNGDGTISEDEFNAKRDRRANMGERTAGDRMGKRGGMRGHRGMHGMRGGMMKGADANNDGAITQAEFSAAMLARFDAADTDRNGTISATEREAQRAERKARMDQMRAARAAQSPAN